MLPMHANSRGDLLVNWKFIYCFLRFISPDGAKKGLFRENLIYITAPYAIKNHYIYCVS